MLQPNQVLQNRYRIEAILSQGGMGAVYRAYDQRLNRAVVVKEMLIATDQTTNKAEAARQFQREAQILAGLRHANLPGVHDYFQEQDSYYLAMDLIEGQSLQQLISPGGLPESVVLAYADQLLNTLQYIHSRGVLHRDIKPGNIIIQPDGRAVLVDFGLVKMAGISGKTATKSFLRGLGTPEYAPPEQYSGGTDQRSDLYSLAATLYHALMGQAPPSVTDQLAGVKLKPMRQLRDDVSANTEQVILKALSMDREQRYADADAMRAAFGKASPPVKRGLAPTRVLTKPLMNHDWPGPAYRHKISAGVVSGAVIVGLVIVALILPRIITPANTVQSTSVITSVTLYPATSPATPMPVTSTNTTTPTPVAPTNTPVTPTPTHTPITPTPTRTPHTPTPTNTPVTPSPTATATQDAGASQLQADACSPRWFFTPWPANEGCPQNKRSAPAEIQVYERGRIVWLGDADLNGQVFVLYNSGSWDNIPGNIEAVGASKASQLGQPSEAHSNFTTCAAHSNANGVVTAYMSDAGGNILSWSIATASFAHLGWRYIANARFSGCG